MNDIERAIFAAAYVAANPSDSATRAGLYACRIVELYRKNLSEDGEFLERFKALWSQQ